MATYITKSNSDKSIGTATLTIGRGYTYSCYESPMMQGQYFWSKTEFYIGPTGFTMMPQVGTFKFDTTLKKFYVQTPGSPSQPSQRIYENDDGAFVIEVKTDIEAQEVVTPSVSASQYASDWNTKLKCNSGKSYLTVDYPLGTYWQVYFNGVLCIEMPTLNPITGEPTDETFWLRSWSMESGVLQTGGMGIGEYGIGAFSEQPIATIQSSDFEFNTTWTGTKQGRRSDGVCTGDAWASMTCSGDTVTMSCNGGTVIGSQNSIYDTGGNECSMGFGVHSDPRSYKEMYYHYEVDNSNLSGIQTSQLQFQTSETYPVETVVNGMTITQQVPYTWTGLTSPTIRYSSSSYRLSGSMSVSQKNSLPMTWTDTATPPFTTDSGGVAGWEETQSGTMPTQIGGVKCLNPQIINNYTQSNVNTNYGEHDISSGNEEEIRNTIVKIEPDLDFDTVDLLEFSDNKVVADKADWSDNGYCTITGNRVTVTEQNLADALANDTKPMIYQEFERDPYPMENYTLQGQNIPTAEYRQRHWTKFRYITKPISHPSHTVFPIRLICKSYGDMKHDQIWILGRDMLLNDEYYDQLMINNHTVDFEDEGKHSWSRYVSSSCDEYMSQVECERLAVWDDSAEQGDEGYGVLYYKEKPMVEPGYLPNIVGRIEIDLPVGEYTLYDMKSKASLQNNDIYCKDEFQQPTDCGCRMPGDDITGELTEQDYEMNRYVLAVKDGMKSFEIPQTSVTHSANYQIDWWQIFTYSMIRNGTIIYPKDDIGEIEFNSVAYTPDANGYLNLECIADNDENPVYWLKYESNKMITKPRVDYLKGDELYRYIGGTQSHTIKLVTEYGGLIHGNSYKQSGGTYYDTSPYHGQSHSLTIGGNGYYEKENVGTQTTVTLDTGKARVIDKVIDGGKYWYAWIYRALIGKIWRDSFGKILRQNEDCLDEGEEVKIMQGGEEQPTQNNGGGN